MLALRIAWRSFLRHRRRSLITASAVSFGLGLMLASVGIAEDSHYRMIDMGVRLGSGHIVVQGKGFQRDQTLDYLVNEPAAVRQRIIGVPGVEKVAPRVRTTGLIRSGDTSSAVLVSGVDPALEPAVSSIADPKKRKKGLYLRARHQMPNPNWPADIYIGTELANTLHVGVGDKVVLTVSPKGGGRPESAAFMVRGIFRTGSDELDGMYVEIPIESAQKLLKLGSAITQLAVMLTDNATTLQTTRALRARLAGLPLETLPWQESMKELYDAIVIDDGGNYVMFAIIFSIVAIGIFNTMLMSVIERTREFGVMMAIGTSKFLLFRIVLAEAFVLALFAALLGVGLGLGLHYWVSSVGIDIAKLAGDDYQIAGVVFDVKIYSRLTSWIVAKWSLVVGALVLVSAIYPAFRATRLQPVEAMRHV